MRGINVVAVSKRISRLNIHVITDAFDMDVVWCRTVYSRSEERKVKKHRHSFYELHYATEGFCEFQMDNQYHTLLSKGNFIIIPPQQMHTLLGSSDNFSKFVFGFHIHTNESNPDGEFVMQAIHRAQAQHAYPASERLSGYVDDIVKSAYAKQPALPTIVSAYLALFIVEAAQQILPMYQENIRSVKIFQIDTQIELVRRFISDNVTNGITGKEVAQQINMSEKQLNRILKANLNMTISKMIEDEKMNCLRKLLTTDMTLDQIAEQAGFSNEYNMGRFFKRLEGMSPGRYRKSLEN